jgi:hypothetical protein
MWRLALRFLGALTGDGLGAWRLIRDLRPYPDGEEMLRLAAREQARYLADAASQLLAAIPQDHQPMRRVK